MLGFAGMATNLTNTPSENKLAPHTHNSPPLVEGQPLLHFKGKRKVIVSGAAAICA